jgi:hypothetical protein
LRDDSKESIPGLKRTPVAQERKTSFLVPRIGQVLETSGTQISVFILTTSLATLIGVYFNVGWELDAATRAQQALYIAQRGAYWYLFQGFGQGYYVWLPLWQLLLAGIYLLTRISTPLIGIAVSATSLGLISATTVSALKRTGFDGRRQALGVALLLTSGYLVAYASQGMTDVFSTMLLFGTVYCLFVYLETRSSRYVAAASLLTLLNVMTRYEAWLFLLIALSSSLYLFLAKKMSRMTMINIIVYAIPSVLFIFIWLYYNDLVSGSFFGFASWIAQNVSTAPPAFDHNPVLTLQNFAEALLLSNGLFWLALLDVRRRGTTAPMLKFATIVFAVYSAYFLYSTYIGFSSGWVRLFLYFVPFSVLSFMSKNYKAGAFYLIIGGSVILGVVGLAQNVMLHQIAAFWSPLEAAFLATAPP